MSNEPANYWVDQNQSALKLNARLLWLDVVRGIAAIAVLITHLGNPIAADNVLSKFVAIILLLQRKFLWCNEGLHWGVVVFIVLSGFCIHLPTARKGKRPELQVFYARRFLRIYPALFAASIVGISVSCLLSGVQPNDFFELFKSLILLPAISESKGPPGNAILITVIVECFLYLLYPLLIPRSKKGWAALICITVVIYLANFSLLRFSTIDAIWLQRNLFAFLPYWWLGALACDYLYNPIWSSSKRPSPRIWITAVGIGYLSYLLVGNFVHFTGAHVFKSLFLALLTAITFVSIGLSHGIQNKKKDRLFSCFELSAKAGVYSYSLYVIHAPLLAMFESLSLAEDFKTSGLWYLTMICMVSVATFCFYKLVEEPSHKRAQAVGKETPATT